MSSSPEWLKAREQIETAIRSVEWPPGSGAFTLYDQEGKGRGKGNGVKPIKVSFLASLKGESWILEQKSPRSEIRGPGPLDATKQTALGSIAVEWETGNVSSSHRAMNKMSLYLLTRKIVAGALIVPTRKMYWYLTGRVGNWDELEPYFPLWSSLKVERGLLAIVAVEHDAVSKDVQRIPKATDGRALG